MGITTVTAGKTPERLGYRCGKHVTDAAVEVDGGAKSVEVSLLNRVQRTGVGMRGVSGVGERAGVRLSFGLPPRPCAVVPHRPPGFKHCRGGEDGSHADM